MKLHKSILAIALGCISLSGCTDLTETVYSEVGSNNYYHTREDVISMSLRAFEHGYWSIVPRFYINELSGDQIITPNRAGRFEDAGVWRMYHYHTWTPDINRHMHDEWDSDFAGIGQCNFAIEQFDKLNPADFQFTQEEFDALKTQNRVLRSWYYLRLLDEFRNVPFAISYDDPSKNTMSQVSPKFLFDFIETELKESIPLLKVKTALKTGRQFANQWTQAGAAAVLARLYLNAEKYIGVNRLDDCEKICQDIVDGKYGKYEVDPRWDAPFDSDNDACDELLFYFSASQNYSLHHYVHVYCHTVPSKSEPYFDDHKGKQSGHNDNCALTPSYDPTGKLYDHKLGMVAEKFRKYPEDFRLVKYKNLGGGKREGMFVYGYLDYVENGINRRVKDPDGLYELYIRDAVGPFKRYSKYPDRWLDSDESNMRNADFSSGWRFAKYPLYSDGDPGQRESDYAEIRLPEVIYTLAECKLRKGDAEGAGKLLNTVRRRYYPEDSWHRVLYAPEGAAKLDMDEMLDEWGREFLGEGRRRVDLIRFGKFSSGTWWDKEPDEDNHTEIFPILRVHLNTNKLLKQNPGYY